MKTLSSAELQEAIRYSTECVKDGLSKSNDYQLHLEHLVALLDEQRRRASERVEYTGTPMTTTLERAEFDARVDTQDVNEAWDPCNPACSPEFGGYIDDNCRCKNRFPVEDGPEWVEIDGLEEIVIELGRRDRLECLYKDGQINKTHGVATVTILPWHQVKEKHEAQAYRIFRGDL